MKISVLSNFILIVFFLVLCSFSVVAYGQSNLLGTPPETLRNNVQEKSSVVLENNRTTIDEKLLAEDNFSAGKGYLIQVPTNHPTVPTVYNGSFAGVPNNGTIQIDLNTGYNMVGNPYPSGISVHHFIDSNPAITGTLYFLKKNSAHDAGTSYATLTKIAYVTNGDKVEDASFGYFEAGNESNWFINKAQGFFVHSAMDAKLIFTNSMRRVTQVNPNFENSHHAVPKKGLYWLNLKNEAGEYSQMAVGYSPEGTMEEDRGVDGKNINLDYHLTSVIDGNEYAIQGRPEFVVSDSVPLSYKVLSSGEYSISIDHAVGIFADNSQLIYIKDKMKNKLHNLSEGPYSFSSKAGTFPNRFTVVYQSR